jgi:hypothetical protein
MGYGPSRQDRGAGNSGEQPVQFKLADAQRIANVVGTVEGARRGRKGSTLPRAAGGGGGGGIQRAKWFCTPGMVWAKGSDKSVTFVENTTQTVSATLVFRSITSKSFVVNLAVSPYTDPATQQQLYYVVNSDCE